MRFGLPTRPRCIAPAGFVTPAWPLGSARGTRRPRAGAPRVLHLLALLFLATLGARAAFGAAAPSLELRRPMTLESATLRITPGPAGDIVSAPGALAGAGNDGLPAWPVTLRLPEGMRVMAARVEIEESAVIDRPVHPQAALSGRYASAAVPAPPRALTAADLIRVGLTGRLRGQTLGGLSYTPFLYEPTTGRLTLVTRATLVVTLAPDPRDRALDFVPLRRAPWGDDTFGALAERLSANGQGGRPDVAAAAAPPAATAAPVAAWHAHGEAATSNPRGATTGTALHPLINSGAPVGPTFRPSVNGGPVEMVILTDDAQAAEYQRLADWKTRSGTPAVVRTVAWVRANYPNGLDTPETLRHFIRDAAQKWGTIYVLLGGDAGVIPVRKGYTQFFGGASLTTDLYYACLDGNWNGNGNALFGEGYGSAAQPGDDADLYPDVWLGRAPTNTAAEARAFVDKTLAWEMTPPAGDYPASVLALAEVLSPASWHWPDPIALDGATQAEADLAHLPAGFARVRMYESCVTGAWPGCVSEYREAVIDSLNAGYGLVDYTGLSSARQLGVGVNDGTLGLADADALTNAARPFFFLGGGTESADIEQDTILEHLLRSGQGGAVGGIGLTSYDLGTASGDFKAEFLHQVFEQGLTTLGPAMAQALLLYSPLAAQDNSARWTLFTEMTLGDPSLTFYTRAPGPLVIAHAATYTLGAGTFAVTVSDAGGPLAGARVTLNKADDDYAVATTDAAGHATLPFAPDLPGPFDLTVTAADHVPYRSGAAVVASADPYLYATTQQIDDDATAPSAGNGDGLIDAGETIALRLPLANRGGATGGGVVATAASLTAGVTLLDATSAYGPVAAGATLAPDDPLVLGVARGVADRTEARLQLTYAAGADTTREEIILYLRAPLFFWYRQVARDTTGNGNGDGMIAPHEDFTLRVQLRNGGQGAARGVVARLTSTDPVFTISDDQVVFGDIPGGQEAVAAPALDTFRFQMSDTTGLGAGAHRLHVQIFDAYAPATPLATFGIDPQGPKTAPTALVAQPGAGAITLRWTSVTAPDRAGYNVYRAAGAGGPFGRVNAHTTDRSSLYVDEPPLPLTLYHYRVAAQDSSGNEGPASAVISAATNPPLAAGFPVPPAGQALGSVTIADLDYDGHLDIVAAADEIDALHADGVEFKDGDNDPETRGPLTHTHAGPFWNAPAVGDLEPDGSPEVAAISWSGQLYVWDSRGNVRPGFPRNLNPDGLADPSAMGSVALADADGNGSLEVFCCVGRTIFGFHGDGTEIVDGDHNPTTLGVLAPRTSTNYSYGTPALADLDGDHLPELIVGMRDGKLYAYHAATGVLLAGFPVTTGGNITSSPAIVNLDTDSHPEIVCGASDSKVYALHWNGTALSGWPQGIQLQEDFDSSPALGDLTGDGIPDVVCGASNGRLFAWRSGGTLLPGWPVFIRDESGANVALRASPIQVDLNGDGTPEILVGDQIGRLHAFYAGGQAVAGFPIGTGSVLEGSPAAWDLDRDGRTEIVAQTRSGEIFVWKTPWNFNAAASPWPMFHHDARHTGDLGQSPFYQAGAPESPEPPAPAVLLMQNRPNPFAATTQLRCRVAAGPGGSPTPVRLDLFNATGRLVRRLLDRPLPPGEYEITWDGRDEAGGRAPGGIYYARAVNSAGHGPTIKLTLVR